VDSDPDELVEDVRRYCGGDFSCLYRIYYETVSQIVEKTNADIIGHIDLITKFNEDGQMFSVDDPTYRMAALDAVDVLLEKDRFFEINSGAISRGCRTTPYPAPFILKEIHDRGGRIMLSSDAHATNTMLFQFEQSMELARSVGYRSVWVLTPEGFREQPI
jgi:histidinol-phosphatase (PHP family)